MKNLGVIVFILSLPIAMFAWYLFAKKSKAKGVGMVRHLGGAVVGFFAGLAVMIVAVFIDPDSRQGMVNAATKPTEQAPQASPNTVVTPEPAPVTAIQSPVAVAPQDTQSQAVQSLDMDFDTFRRRVNDDFLLAGLPYKISSTIEPSGKEVRKIATIQLDDYIGFNVTTDPATKKVASIFAIMTPSDSATKNMQNAAAIALVLASADGDEGNKTVAGDLIKMMSKTMGKFAKNPNDATDAKLIRNNIQYGISVSKSTGIMMWAEPAK